MTPQTNLFFPSHFLKRLSIAYSVPNSCICVACQQDSPYGCLRNSHFVAKKSNEPIAKQHDHTCTLFPRTVHHFWESPKPRRSPYVEHGLSHKLPPWWRWVVTKFSQGISSHISWEITTVDTDLMESNEPITNHQQWISFSFRCRSSRPITRIWLHRQTVYILGIFHLSQSCHNAPQWSRRRGHIFIS